MKNVEIVSLIYTSLDYLHFIADQLKSDLCKAKGWDVGVRIVANDATEEILEALAKLDIPYTVFNNPDPDEFYLNRVYRAYNHCITSSEYDNVVLVNSDNRFSEGWLENLLKHHDGVNIPCSRSIESGKMASGKHGVNLGESNFGRHPNEFDVDGWTKWVEENKEDKTEPHGLYMPCLLNKKQMEDVGLYPTGNMFIEEPNPGERRIVCGYPNDRPVWMAGDDFFFHHVLESRGMKHITVFDSLAYHIQEGEKDA
tara:strand:+ start:2409 stop:3173 length:765 start_codon:yes stop_codon:yes gene_type:complete